MNPLLAFTDTLVTSYAEYTVSPKTRRNRLITICGAPTTAVKKKKYFFGILETNWF